MKHVQFIFAVCLFSLLFFNACRKKEEITQTVDLTDDEVADVIEASLKTSTAGLSANLDDITVWLAEGSGKTEATTEWTCNYMGDSTLNKSGSLGNTTYNYSLDYGYEVSCSNVPPIPNAFIVDCNTNGTYSNSRIESDDNSIGVFTITELLNPNSDYLLNGILTRTGSESHKTRNISFGSICTATLINIAIDKTTYVINGGSAAITLTAKNDTELKNYTASVNFSGEGMAVVTINNQEYTIHLNQ